VVGGKERGGEERRGKEMKRKGREEKGKRREREKTRKRNLKFAWCILSCFTCLLSSTLFLFSRLSFFPTTSPLLLIS
jgi:hypothetical protein